MRRFCERLEDRRLLAAVMGVLGNSLTITDGDSTPSHDDFTNYGPIGFQSGAVTRQYTIRNTGDTALNLQAIQIGGTNAADFTVQTAPNLQVGANGSTTFTIKFDPSAAGTRSAMITIPRTDMPGNPYNFSIQGTALNATIAANGLQTATTQAGSGREAVSGDTLRVNYTGYLLNGHKFDSSLNPGRVPFEFTIDESNVIQGWHQGMKGLKVGEKRVLIIPPALGYGGSANGDIPANSTLIFEVELLGFVPPEMRVSGLGQVIPDNDTTPVRSDGTHFGSIGIGAKQTHTFVISAHSSAQLKLIGSPQVQLLGTSGNDFTVTQPVFGGGVARFTVTFTPSSLGPSSATISIPSNDPDNNPYNFVVRGEGRTTVLSSVGVMQSDGKFKLDFDANRIADAADWLQSFGAAGDKPVAGDWTGTGVKRIGVYRGNKFLLDINGDGTFGAGDATYEFGLAGDTPIVGDWNGDGIDDMGVWRSGVFYLDSNGSRDWSGPTVDAVVSYGPAASKPVIGDWNGDGVDDIGVFYANGSAGTWLIDLDGSRTHNAADPGFAFGASTDVPISGDFKGTGTDYIGVYRAGKFILDLDNNRTFNAANDAQFDYGPTSGALPITGMWTRKLPQSVGVYRNGVVIRDADRTHSATGGDLTTNFGQPGDKPIAGDWSGNGKRNVGVFRNGQFFLDINGNGTYDAGDTTVTFGQAGDRPVAGDWDGDGVTDLGVFRNGTFLLRTENGTITITTDVQGQPLAGDWNGDGKDELGLRVGKTFFLDTNANRVWDGPGGGDQQINFGLATDRGVIGDWNGDGIADLGVFRGNGMFVLRAAKTGLSDFEFVFGQANDLPYAFV